VLVVIVRHLGVRKGCTLRLEMASKVGQVACARLGQGELVGFIALLYQLVPSSRAKGG
jgi:hypothetical protein